MSETKTVGIIRPEVLAKKLAGIRNYEHPEQLEQINRNERIPEVLWFLQAMSMQAGGLVRFVAEMVEQINPEVFGTPTMRAARTEKYSVTQKVQICREISSRYQPHQGGELTEDVVLRGIIADAPLDGKEFLGAREALQAYLEGLGAAQFREVCKKAARDLLPSYLAALCVEEDRGFAPRANTAWAPAGEIWFMADPLGAVATMMEMRAGTVSARLAKTAVALKVFDALDYAYQERAMVRVEGDSRFGKTEAVKTWCEMRPGLARLVSVPCSNSVADLVRRVAEALGMEISYGSRAQRLKERVEFVLKHSGLFIVLDEAAFLLPQNYYSGSAPARLNWVRTEIVDRGLPLAMVVTPQSFLPAVSRFVKRTGYAMEQFFGRNHRVVQLPGELSPEDMVSVARIHFPDMGEDYLALIADYARVSENYLQTVEALAKLSRFKARQLKHPRVSVGDIESAALEIIPQRTATVAVAPIEESAVKAGTRLNLRKDARAVKPGLTSVQRGSLSPCSLRAVSPVEESAESVLVDS